MKTSKILVKDDRVISVSIPVYFFKVKNDKYIHAQCSSLGIISSGETLEKAKKMFSEALDIWIEWVEEKGTIKEALKDLGWKIASTIVIPKEKPIDVPIELLASKMVNLEISTSRLN
ncbi:MAG: type II toxin-antitoxin system HicB family antitoxin [Endomicrobium sp.]|jgi:predicted RNase H-like HicB family nuclease|nr:type II toxin-antitoxin system HicB family antitoxin [Endomicrobium sp.]